MATITKTRSQTKEFGFSVSEGADWSSYMSFRPLYPKSFFNRIFEYHALKSQSEIATAHDIGAGCGIVASSLASRFRKVIVSDPNEGYTKLAKKLLVEDSGIPETRFNFLQEGAEKSSIETSTTDLITACEMIHWTDLKITIKEFNRELKTGGTLALTYYTRPQIVDNEAAQKVWQKLFDEYASRAQGQLYDHAFEIVNSGLQCVAFPENEWDNVKRVYINCGGTLDVFKLDARLAENAVNVDEETIWVEDDADWQDIQGIDWLKGYFETWVPKISESEVQDLWNEMSAALDGGKAKIETSIVMILATKKV